MGKDDRGQALPLLALVVLAAGVAAVLVGKVASEALTVTRAATAADAAALAAAGDGDEAARVVAAANGARVVRIERDGAEAEVTVVLDGAEVNARARRETSQCTGFGVNNPRNPVGIDSKSRRSARCRGREFVTEGQG